jgi:hypothetical protein
MRRALALERLQLTTRRQFLNSAGQLSLGAIALNAMAAENATASNAVNPLAMKQPRFPAKAKRVIYLHMSGAPPHLDLFDYKPELVKRDGQDCPDSFLKGTALCLHDWGAEADGHAAHV